MGSILDSAHYAFSRYLFGAKAPIAYRKFHDRFPKAAEQLKTLSGLKILRPHFGGQFVGDIRDHCIKYLFLRGFFEWQTLLLCKAVVRNDDIIVEVGGNVGTETMAFCRYVPKGQVICFEPSAASASVIEFNAAMNGYKNLVLERFPVSDASDNFSQSAFNELNSGTVFMEPDQDGPLQAKSLDRYMSSLETSSGIRYFHIDCEGYEVKALRGAVQTIETSHPTIFVEVNNRLLQRAGNQIDELFDFLSKRDYRVFWFDEMVPGLVEVTHAQQTAHHPADWMAIHKTKSGQGNFLDVLKRRFLESYMDRRLLIENIQSSAKPISSKQP